MVSFEHPPAGPAPRPRAQWFAGLVLSPKHLSFAIAVLALYGDLVKRVLSPTAALFTLYGAAIGILLVMTILGRGRRGRRAPLISTLSWFLIVVYVAQFLTSFSADIFDGIKAVVYVCVPLAFVALIPRAYPEFDLRALAFYTTILMIPIHAVGVIQMFVDPSFMISAVYSEAGGVIDRNFLDAYGGAFIRFPSLFASADRYSGVAMMQIFLAFILLAGRAPTRKTLVWVVLSLIAGVVSLLIAGARSRIMIVGIALFASAIVLFVNIVWRKSATRLMRFALGIIVAGIGFTALLGTGYLSQAVTSYPVLDLLSQSIEVGDIGDRFEEGVHLTSSPEKVSFFGEGLGVTAGGRPGEFGVRAMWIEGGLFWTWIMLAIHSGILFLLGRVALLLAWSGNALLTPPAVGHTLAWLLALLAGLSSTFELSQALLLFPAIGVFTAMIPGRQAM